MRSTSQPVRDALGAGAARPPAIPSAILHTAEPPANATVTINARAPGIEVGGAVIRCDGVAPPLRPALDSTYPSAETVLLAIVKRVRQTPNVGCG